jgi:exonuclease III
VKLGDLDA